MNRLLLIICIFIYSSIPAFSSLPYDYSSVKAVPIKMKITEEISTKQQIYEGKELTFKVISNVFYKNKFIVKKNQIIKARIEMIVTSGMNGFPAEIIIDNFDIPNVRKTQLMSTYIKTGQNRSLIVYPIKLALSWLPGVGNVVNLIKGGHAKIKTKDTVTIYYYPEWK